LACNLEHLGRAKEAELLHRKALAIEEEVLGQQHPDTASCYSNLALNIQDQGRAQEAEPLHRKALAIREEGLGPRHPDTALSYNNLATNLQAQGRAQEAELLHRKALAIREEVLGPRHADTAFSYENLASTLDSQGRAREAEPLLHKALAVRAEVLGPRHPDTAQSYHRLAVNLDSQGRYKEAEQLKRQALAINEEVLGPKHPDTAESYHGLAYSLADQGRTKEAELFNRKALAIREKVLGPKHPQTALSYNNLAFDLLTQGRAVEAEPLIRQALTIREQVQGPQHPDTAQSLSMLGVTLGTLGRPREAEPLLRRALAIKVEVLGPLHPATVLSFNNLAGNLQSQGRVKEAESLWQAGVDGVEATRLRLASSAHDKAAAIHAEPHLGLAVCRARLGDPSRGWAAAEAALARGLLDDLALRTTLPTTAEELRRDRERGARIDVLDRLLPPLLTREKLDEDDRRRRDELLHERQTLDNQAASAVAERSSRNVLPLADVQAALAADAALVFWVDLPAGGDHWGCVLRPQGLPVWVSLKGTGPQGSWTKDDHRLPRLLRENLALGEPDAERQARQLAAQRLVPLEPHLAASAHLPAVRQLIVVPVGHMAGVPVEVLTNRYRISYAPSGSVLTRLRKKHRPLESPSLLALGDPDFTNQEAGPPPEPPRHGLYVALVLPGSNAARAGLRNGDVLLTYSGQKLTTRSDLKVAEVGTTVPVSVWREGKVLDQFRVDPGKLGIIITEDAPAVALRKRRELDLLADARERSDTRPLPGTRLEVTALASLLPREKATLLLGSRASEQELDNLARTGKRKGYRLLHLATHGNVDPVSAAQSALLLARDRLPEVEEQNRLRGAGQKVPTGRLTAGDIAETWDLDADLVVLSACQTGLGPDGRGEGLLGFSQVLLGKGARSLLLSLWKVDDTATALLMTRFYQNLLGKRDGLKAGLPKAEALQEAKQWLRSLPRAEVEHLAGALAKGVVRSEEEPAGRVLPAAVPVAPLPAGPAPFAHPRYWAAFILIGDPD
jgi:CHAT domain-containing protein/tetratricopeptide (TPR) repeat protein